MHLPSNDAATTNGSEAEPVQLDLAAFPWQEFATIIPSGPSGSVRLTVGDTVTLLAIP